MKVIFIISVLFTISECLKCRSENDEKTVEEYEDIVRSCLRMEDENKRTNDRWKGSSNRGNHRTQNGRGKYGSRDDDETEEDDDDYGHRRQNRKDQNKRGQSTNTDLNTGRKKPQRDKHNEDEYDYEDSYSNTKNRQNSSKDRNSQRGNKNENRRGQNQEPGYNSDSGMHNYYNLGSHYNNSSKRQSSPLHNVDACIIHCMFRQMKMVNENSMLDKSNIMSTLTRRIRDPELKEFIQDSVQECFENLDRDGHCERTKAFAICLEEKGRNNCEDWDLNGKQGNRRNKYEDSYPYQNSRG